MSDAAERVRLDVWLWAARFFKTRRLAVEAIKSGKVRVCDQPAKPSRDVHIGDTLHISRGDERFEVVVEGVSSARGPAPVARQLYRETEGSVLARERQRELARFGALHAPHPHNRPDKRDRRRLAGMKRENG